MSKRKKPAYSGGLVLDPKKGQSIGYVNMTNKIYFVTRLYIYRLLDYIGYWSN